jgi:uncharacterized protein (UPF0303 family)
MHSAKSVPLPIAFTIALGQAPIFSECLQGVTRQRNFLKRKIETFAECLQGSGLALGKIRRHCILTVR